MGMGDFVGIAVVMYSQFEQVHKLFDCEILEQVYYVFQYFVERLKNHAPVSLVVTHDHK